MNLHTLIMTRNPCYLAGRVITPRGIMVHSTGVNNPYLKRFVGPDDGLLGVNPYNNHWNQPHPRGRSVCVHAFIGKLADESIATYQTLPWSHRAWHCGDDANNTHISFEICEDGRDDAAYFGTVYQEAVELCAHLCRLYKLDPLKDGVLICHSEGYKRRIASNHSDVMHWFPKFGRDMDSFRAAVRQALDAGEPITVGSVVSFRPGTTNYYPGSSPVPAWARDDYYHKVTKELSGGGPVVKGGKTCVLLGTKISKETGAEEPGINTWVDRDVLIRATAPPEPDDPDAVYTVQRGDTLWDIAEAKLGSGFRYPEIVELNRLSTYILRAGQVLKIPEK